MWGRVLSRSTNGGGDSTILFSGMLPEQQYFPGIGSHHPLPGWQTHPEFNSFYQRDGKKYPQEGLFSCRPRPTIFRPALPPSPLFLKLCNEGRERGRAGPPPPMERGGCSKPPRASPNDPQTVLTPKQHLFERKSRTKGRNTTNKKSGGGWGRRFLVRDQEGYQV